MFRQLMLFTLGATALSCAAQAAPPTTLLAGTLTNPFSVAGTNGWNCGVNSGIALFQRAARTAKVALPPATIAVPGVSYYQQFSGYDFQGTALLSFTSATAGKIAFDYAVPATAQTNSPLPSGDNYPFKAYHTTWDSEAGTLLVSFTIVFPNCSLPVTAFFRG